MNFEAEDDDLNIGASATSQVFKAPFDIRSSTLGSVSSVTTAISSGSEFQLPRHFIHLQQKKQKSTIGMNQERMNDIVRDMNLTKENSELLASRLNDMGLCDGK